MSGERRERHELDLLQRRIACCCGWTPRRWGRSPAQQCNDLGIHVAGTVLWNFRSIVEIE